VRGSRPLRNGRTPQSPRGMLERFQSKVPSYFADPFATVTGSETRRPWASTFF